MFSFGPFCSQKFFTGGTLRENNMGTKQPARCLIQNGVTAMQDIKDTIARDIPGFVQDFAGAVALISILVVALNLPSLF